MAHLTAVKRIFCYLKETEWELDTAVQCWYWHSAWACWIFRCRLCKWHWHRRSTRGNVFMVSDGAVSWLSNKQTTVALSTTEAEYFTLNSATQEAIWSGTSASVSPPPYMKTIRVPLQSHHQKLQSEEKQAYWRLSSLYSRGTTEWNSLCRILSDRSNGCWHPDQASDMTTAPDTQNKTWTTVTWTTNWHEILILSHYLTHWYWY